MKGFLEDVSLALSMYDNTKEFNSKISLEDFKNRIVSLNPELATSIDAKQKSLHNIVLKHLVFFQYSNENFKLIIKFLRDNNFYPLRCKAEGKFKVVKFGLNNAPLFTKLIINNLRRLQITETNQSYKLLQETTIRVKTITCHQVYNPGASLQEYALLYYLNTNGFQAEAIQYKPSYLSNHFNFFSLSSNKYNKPVIKQLALLAKLPSKIIDLKRKKAFDDFALKYIPTGKERFTSNDELKNNLPEADVYICGSDQIWNSLFNNGKDPAFYLDFVPDHKLTVSYAASMATDTIADELKPFVKEKISKIKLISVRETSALSILADLQIGEAEQVLDPVFLLDKQHWANFVNPINDDFIFVYDFDSNPIIKQMALQFKAKNKVKIYTINKNINYADVNFHLHGPEKFLSLTQKAQFVLTNSFHCVAFSLIFEKQFFAFNRNEEINTRSRDLLQLLQLNNLIDKAVDFNIYQSLDYKVVNKIIAPHIEKSNNFLLNIKKHV